MRRTTYAMLFFVYFYAQILGVVNFYYDCRTGKARTTVFVTVYSIIMSAAMFGVIPYFALTMEIKTRPPGAAELHYKLNLTIALIRIGGVLITLIFNWTYRKNFIRLLNNLQEFSKTFLQKWQATEKFEKYMEDGIRRKFFCEAIADFIMFMGSMQVFRDIFEVDNPFVLFALATVPTVLNVIMTHYYFALLNMNSFLILINNEIKRILNTSAQLYKQKHLKLIKAGAFVNQCCKLSEELDDLAADMLKLQKFMKSFNKIYDVQGVCCMLSIYVNNISVMYMGFMMSKHEQIWHRYGPWAVYIVPVGLVIYYIDLSMFFHVIITFVDLSNRSAELLKDRQPWLPTLDERLEKSLKNFSLQLAAFPSEIDLVGLYKMSRPMSFSIFGSTISNAIVLIQYDFKSSK